MTTHPAGRVDVTSGVWSSAERTAWSAIAQRHSEGTIYHTPEWLEVIAHAYGLAVYRLSWESGGDDVGILPLVEMRTITGKRILVSVPFSNSGGPLAAPPVRLALLEAARALGRDLRSHFVEIRPGVSDQVSELPMGPEYVSCRLDLRPGAEAIWRERLSDKCRDQVRKFRRGGLRLSSGSEQTEAFARLYARRQRDLGTPTHGSSWFREMAERLGDRLEVVLAWDGELPVAGALLLFHGDTATVQHGASLSHFLPRCPNHGVYWHAVELACARGCSRLDLGRSRPGSGNMRFKRHWGPEVVWLPYRYLLLRARRAPGLRVDDPSWRWATRLWRTLPLPVASWLGPRLRSRLPV